MKNKRMNFSPSKKIVDVLSPIQAAKELKALVTKERPGRSQKFNRNNGLVQPKPSLYPKYIMRDGIPHKIVDGKWVALTAKVTA